MKKQSYTGKTIIWESKIKQFLLITICLVFVAINIWTYKNYNSLAYWGSLILFGGGGFFLFARLLNPNNVFVTYKSKLGKQIMAERETEVRQDLGFFSYDDEGFCLLKKSGTVYYKWSEIEAIFGYKEDCITTDEILIDVFINETILRLEESIPGWYQFTNKLSENIPVMPKNWFEQIMFPPFQTNTTLLFDRKNRTKEYAEAELYS